MRETIVEFQKIMQKTPHNMFRAYCRSGVWFAEMELDGITRYGKGESLLAAILDLEAVVT